MVDFLKENPWCSVEQYKWGFSSAQISLMSVDFTHSEYLNSDAAKSNKKSDNDGAITINSVEDLKNLNDFGSTMIPILNKKKE